MLSDGSRHVARRSLSSGASEIRPLMSLTAFACTVCVCLELVKGAKRPLLPPVFFHGGLAFMAKGEGDD